MSHTPLPFMPFQVDDGMLIELGNDTAPVHDTASLERKLLRAWAMRQRQSSLALALSAEIASCVDRIATRATVREQWRARLILIEAEVRWLEVAFDAASSLTEQALRTFTILNDPIGVADAQWLLAWIATDLGDIARRDSALRAAAFAAMQGGDPIRAVVVSATQVRWALLCDAQLGQQMMEQFPADVSGLALPAQAAIHDCRGLAWLNSIDAARGVTNCMQAHATALACGQLRMAIIAATNAAEGFRDLNDNALELEWAERAVALARPTGWPRSIGASLMYVAEALRNSGHLEAAREILVEACQILQPVAKSRPYTNALNFLASVQLDLGEYDLSLAHFRQMQQHAESLRGMDLVFSAMIGQARALLRLGRADEALAQAHRALAAASTHGELSQVLALQVLSEVHAAFSIPFDTSGEVPNAALHYLMRALTLARQIDTFNVPPGLFEAISEQYAKVEDYRLAYDYARQAIEARANLASRDTLNRAVALQVQRETESARAQSAHHQQLAQAEAARAQLLSETNDTLERLGAVGRELTASLETAAICSVIARHIADLFEAHAFALYLLDDDAAYMNSVLIIEGGAVLPAERIAVNDPVRHVAHCVRTGGELDLRMAAGQPDPSHVPGTLPMGSALFLPMTIGARITGAMTVQSTAIGAFNDRDRLVARTLCNYLAIALDNAAGYQRLADTLNALQAAQAQLEEMSLTDPLTGLRNRRYLLQHIGQDVSFCLRHAESGTGGMEDLVFFLIDIDHFKAVNDQFGHAAGDRVLVDMAARLRRVFRDSDHVVRWGGEEFLCVARRTDRTLAPRLAQRICHEVASQPFALEDGTMLNKTCSVGFASFPVRSDAAGEMAWSKVVEQADAALYQAKHGGRNRWINGDAPPGRHQATG